MEIAEAVLGADIVFARYEFGVAPNELTEQAGLSPDHPGLDLVFERPLLREELGELADGDDGG